MNFNEIEPGTEFTFVKNQSPILAIKINPSVWGVFNTSVMPVRLTEAYCVVMKPHKIDVYTTGRSFILPIDINQHFKVLAAMERPLNALTGKHYENDNFQN